MTTVQLPPFDLRVVYPWMHPDAVFAAKFEGATPQYWLDAANGPISEGSLVSSTRSAAAYAYGADGTLYTFAANEPVVIPGQGLFSDPAILPLNVNGNNPQSSVGWANNGSPGVTPGPLVEGFFNSVYIASSGNIGDRRGTSGVIDLVAGEPVAFKIVFGPGLNDSGNCRIYFVGTATTLLEGPRGALSPVSTTGGTVDILYQSDTSLWGLWTPPANFSSGYIRVGPGSAVATKDIWLKGIDTSASYFVSPIWASTNSPATATAAGKSELLNVPAFEAGDKLLCEVRWPQEPGTEIISHHEGYTWRGLDEAFDYVIDAATGDDGDAGTEAEPWKTLNMIGEIPLSAAADIKVLVRAGTYDTADDYVERSDGSAGGAIGAGAHLTIVYEPGCVIDGAAANAVAPTSGHEFSGSAEWTCTVFANGATVQNFAEGTASSPNGFGNRGANILYVYDAHCVNCDDGFSSHGNARMYLDGCSAQGSEKSPFIHTDNAIVEARKCRFESSSGGSLAMTSEAFAGEVSLYDCEIVPFSSGELMRCEGPSFRRCRIGTETKSVQIIARSRQASMEACYINLYADGIDSVAVDKCFGRLTSRVRGGGVQAIENCVLTGPATGQTSIVASTYDSGAAQALVFNDNIVTTATAAEFMSVDAANAGYLVAANAEFFNNFLAGSAAYDADLTAADTLGTVVTGTVTGDPLIGAADTMDMADFAFGSGSPAAGAGTGGADIGFGDDDVEYLEAPSIGLGVIELYTDGADLHARVVTGGAEQADIAIADALSADGTLSDIELSLGESGVVLAVAGVGSVSTGTITMPSLTDIDSHIVNSSPVPDNYSSGALVQFQLVRPV